MLDATYRALEVAKFVFRDSGDGYVLRLEEQAETREEAIAKMRLQAEMEGAVGLHFYWSVYRFPDDGPSMWVCDCGTQQDVAEHIAKAMALHEWESEL